MTDLDFVDEQSLLAAARAGDEEAFGRLVAQHREGLEQFCYLMLGDAHDGKCALEQTVLGAWRQRELAEPAATPRCGYIGTRWSRASKISTPADEFACRGPFDLLTAMNEISPQPGPEPSLERRSSRRRTRVPPAGRPVSPSSAGPLLPDAGFAVRRGGRCAGDAAAGVARTDRFEPRAAFQTWLYRIATNACLDELERRPRRPEPLQPFPDSPLDEAASPTYDPAARYAIREGMELALLRAIQELPVASARC